VNLQIVVACLLGAAVVLSSARLLLRWRRGPARPRTWRAAFLLGAQLATAALLYLALFPPDAPAPAGGMTVLTADADRVSGVMAHGRVVALPEAGGPAMRWPGAERVPDLATALRRHPATRRLQVIGRGLPARDREAAKGLALRFDPAPLPSGLQELQLPEAVSAGRSFAVSGRAHALSGGGADLLDPAGRRVARAAFDDAGRFALHGSARDSGLADFALQLRDARGRVVERIALPLRVLPARRLRALALAGAPDAELKFLRRWALDAGIDLDVRIELGAGLQIGRASLDAAALDRLDLLIADERSWRGLGAGQRAAVLAAVERGLGLLLRVSAGGGGERRTLRTLGFQADPAPRREVRLGAGFVRAGDAVDALPAIVRSPLQLAAGDGVVALADGRGTPLAVWRARGRGRIGVAGFDDSYRLVLAGRNDAHGEVWSRLAGVLARPAAGTAPPTFRLAPPGERSSLCGLGTNPNTPRVIAPDGSSRRLLPDPRTGAANCAGFWASAPGWHLLRDGARATPFFIRAAAEAPGLQASILREATLALATPVQDRRTQPSTPGPRWPWFLAWLILTAALWWLERSRYGLAFPSKKD
jgi:hypothetical protein